MSAFAPEREPRRLAPLFAYASFAVMAGGWAAFAVAIVVSPQSLDDVASAVRGLPPSPAATSSRSSRDVQAVVLHDRDSVA